jgi:histone deacetylase 1/2
VALAELLWLQSLLTKLGVHFCTPNALCDNMSIIALTHILVLHAKTKHVELDLCFVRENVLQKQLNEVHIPGQF